MLGAAVEGAAVLGAAVEGDSVLGAAVEGASVLPSSAGPKDEIKKMFFSVKFFKILIKDLSYRVIKYDCHIILGEFCFY